MQGKVAFRRKLAGADTVVPGVEDVCIHDHGGSV